MARRIDTRLFGLCLVSVLLGIAFVVRARAGAPYDEPSHFSTVIYYARHASLPVLGTPGVSYEAQHPPVYYSLAALVYTAASHFGTRFAFYAIRFAGALVVTASVGVAYALARRGGLGPDRALAAAAVVAVSAPIMAMGTSVQNDMLAILLADIAVLVVVGRDGRPEARNAALSGLLMGLALMTKLTVTCLVLAIPVWILLCRGRRALPPIAAFLLPIASLSGWWFVRNLALYGDLTGVSATRRAYPGAFADAVQPSVRAAMHILQELLGYHWVPTEYYRNLFRVPAPAAVAIALFTVAACAGLVLSARRRVSLAWLKSVPGLYAICALLAVSLWVLVYMGTQTPPRFTYPAFFAYAIGLVAGLAELARRTRLGAMLLFGCLLVFMGSIDLYVLYELGAVPHFAFEMFRDGGGF